jgi:hypothetical protein
VRAFPAIGLDLPDTGDDGLLVDLTIIATFKNLVVQEAGRIRAIVMRGEDEVRLGNLAVTLPPKEAAN